MIFTQNKSLHTRTNQHTLKSKKFFTTLESIVAAACFVSLQLVRSLRHRPFVDHTSQRKTRVSLKLPKKYVSLAERCFNHLLCVPECHCLQLSIFSWSQSYLDHSSDHITTNVCLCPRPVHVIYLARAGVHAAYRLFAELLVSASARE